LLDVAFLRGAAWVPLAPCLSGRRPDAFPALPANQATTVSYAGIWFPFGPSGAI